MADLTLTLEGIGQNVHTVLKLQGILQGRVT